jgi:hypothetical protein
MTDSRETSRAKTVAWLAGGSVAGALVTLGLVFLIVSWLDREPTDPVASPPLFEEVTASAGVRQVYDGEFQFFVGGGVAIFDCNDDRIPDLFVAGGTNRSGLYVNQSLPGGSIGFEREPAPESDLLDVVGAYPIDVDSDGLTDLAVLRVGENVMLRGVGDCRFERANETWGIDGGEQWTVAFSARWEGEEAYPTMAFGNYLRLGESGDRSECEDHFLFRPDGDGYSEANPLAPGYCTLSILFSDWDRAGHADLRMTNDRHYYTEGREQLWKTDAPVPTEYSDEDGWNSLKIWGMGIASQDLDEDGLPEVFLTSQGDNKLQTLSDGSDRPQYEDIALASRVTAHRPFAGDTLRPSTAWHAEFDDVNNDGFIDLFVTKGNVEAQPDFAMEDPNNLLIGGPAGIFDETADVSGLLDYARSRGAGVVDLNLDGLLDVVVVERREPVRLWQNTGRSAEGSGPGHWLQIDLVQSGVNRDAIGSWVEVEVGNRTVTREVTIGGGHASGELGWIHFGLGSADEAKARVIWPDGESSAWQSLEADQRYVWNRESGVETWAPSRD